MTDTYELNKLISQKGLKKRWIAEQMGLSPYGLHLKISNVNQFTAIEIQKLCDLLDITSLKEKERIFFAIDVDKMSTK